MKHRVKQLLLPTGSSPRRLPVGIGRGLTMQIDFAEQTRTYLGLYEIELNRYLDRLLGPRGVTAFDVGGQNGYDALVIAKLTRARVASFEADSRCVATMKRTFKLNRELEPYLTAVEAWIGDEPGQLGLDEWARGPEGFVPGFIKIDIEGSELAALRSADGILSERRPGLIVEVHSPELERSCGALLVEHGYRPRIVNQRRVLPDRRPDSHNRWLIAEGRDVAPSLHT